MTERWVLNASPIIVLARIGREHLFHALADEVVVPRAVAMEIEAGPADDPARQTITSGYFTIVETVPEPDVLAWDLGSGETAVLSYALNRPGWMAILDDAMARKCARSRLTDRTRLCEHLNKSDNGLTFSFPGLAYGGHPPALDPLRLGT